MQHKKLERAISTHERLCRRLEVICRTLGIEDSGQSPIFSQETLRSTRASRADRANGAWSWAYMGRMHLGSYNTMTTCARQPLVAVYCNRQGHTYWEISLASEEKDPVPPEASFGRAYPLEHSAMGPVRKPTQWYDSHGVRIF